MVWCGTSLSGRWASIGQAITTTTLALAAGLLVLSCGGSDPQTTDGSGGTSAGGGASSSGGTVAARGGQSASNGGSNGGQSTGGKGASGGSNAFGGAGGTSTGGRTSAGGGPSTGGNTGAGAQTDAGGDAGAGGGADEPPLIAAPTLPKPGSSLARPAQGEVIIKTPEEATAFCQSYDGVVGSLRIQGSMVDLSALACLVEVTGQLDIGAYGLKSAALPNLVSVGTLLITTQSALTEIDLPKLAFTRNELRIVTTGPVHIPLPALQSVGKGLYIASITTLKSVSLPALTYVGEKIDFSNSNLTDIDVTNLLFVGGDFRLDKTSLQHLSLEHLRQVLGFLIIPGGSYADIDLSGLERVDGALTVDGDELSTELEKLELPKLALAGIFGVGAFPELTTVDVPLLRATKAFALGPDPKLTHVSCPELVDAGSIGIGPLGEGVTLDLPKVKTATYVHVDLGGLGAFNLPALEKADKVEIYGALSIDLPSLVEIDDGTLGLQIPVSGTKDCELHLPSLTTALSLTLGDGIRLAELPSLTKLGQFTAVNTRIEELVVPGVTTLRALSVAENDALTKVSFPDLVNSDNTGISGVALTEVDLPTLATAKDYLSFSGFEALSTLDLPELTSAGSVSFGKAPSLKKVDMPKLNDVDSLTLSRTSFETFENASLTQILDRLAIEENSLLTSVSLPNATSPAAPYLSVTRNSKLTELTLPRFDWVHDCAISLNPMLVTLEGIGNIEQSFSLTIVDNTGLASLAGLSALDRVSGDLTIYGNPLLASEDVDAFVAGIGTITGKVVLAQP
jgi:hypothetical protein